MRPNGQLGFDAQETANEVRQTFGLPIFVYIVIHSILFMHNLFVPGVILRGDRAGQRLAAIESFIETPGRLPQLVLETGWPGDWLAHGLIWWMGGPLLLVLVQIGLGVATIAATVGIARALGAAPAAASTAGIVAAVLPGGIMNPHLLVTETWFTAAIALAAWAFVEAVRRDRAALVVVGMLLLALGGLIRQQGLIFAPTAFVALWFVAPRLRRAAALGVLAAVAISPGVWLGWRYWLGEIGMGETRFDVAYNLRLRAERVLGMAGFDEVEVSQRIDASHFSLVDFIEVAGHYPAAVMRSYIGDLVNVILNPGANHLFVIYLNLIENPSNQDFMYWLSLRDEHGFIAVMQNIYYQGLGFIFALAIMSVIHFGALVAAATGVWYIARYSSPADKRAAWVVFALFATVVATFFGAGLFRWMLRSPLEPLVAAFAGLGLFMLYRLISTRRHRRPDRAVKARGS
jgi:hypothetical protein